MIRVHKSKAHQRGWAKRALRERRYAAWFRSFKDRVPTEAERAAKRRELGFGKKALQAPNTRWAVVFLEQAHKHVREAFHTLENPLGIDKDWPAYHEALCIIENAMAELDGLAAQKYIR